MSGENADALRNKLEAEYALQLEEKDATIHTLEGEVDELRNKMDELYAKISVLTDILNAKGDDHSKFALNAINGIGLMNVFDDKSNFRDSRGVFTRLYNDAKNRMARLDMLQKKKKEEVEKLLSKIAKGMMLFEDGDVTDGSAGADFIR